MIDPPAVLFAADAAAPASETVASSMTTLEAAVLGVVQGLTEYLPISSTAHLRVIPALLGWKDPGAAFSAVIQLGTLVAVLVYFWGDIVRLTRAFLAGLGSWPPWSTPDARMAWMIALGTLPVVICGVLFKKHIETTWRSLYVISGSAIVLALLLLAAEQLVHFRQRTGARPRELADLGWLDAVVVGLAQAVALVPGASRSGVTITGSLFLGMTRETAARFSFLLSLPALFAAGVKELYDERAALLASKADAFNLLLATVVSGLVGYASIAFLLGYLRTHSTYLFIGYRLVLGTLLLILLAAGVLAP
jgi:undecaprenyl-diphosphatase